MFMCLCVHIMPVSLMFRTAPANHLHCVLCKLLYGHCLVWIPSWRIWLQFGLKVRVFPGGYDYRSVEVNGTEYTSVAVPLIYIAAGLQGFINSTV